MLPFRYLFLQPWELQKRLESTGVQHSIQPTKTYLNHFLYKKKKLLKMFPCIVITLKFHNVFKLKFYNNNKSILGIKYI